MRVEVVLVTGESRTIALPGHSGPMPNVLDRLDDWIATEDGGCVQKRFIVEVRGVSGEEGLTERTDDLSRATKAAGARADPAED